MAESSGGGSSFGRVRVHPSSSSAVGAPLEAQRSKEQAAGKQDLLMRFFESDFFDAWIAVT